jgi:hypothetical protein
MMDSPFVTWFFKMHLMKLFTFFPLAIFLSLATDSCDKKTKEAGVYKGKLEIKALCMNYTIGLVEGEIDTSLIVRNWTDESTGKSYANVFRLENPCNFPSTIKEGEEFYFSIDTAKQEECIVCMAYYPTPPKKLPIKIVEKEIK